MLQPHRSNLTVETRIMPNFPIASLAVVVLEASLSLEPCSYFSFTTFLVFQASIPLAEPCLQLATLSWRASRSKLACHSRRLRLSSSCLRLRRASRSSLTCSWRRSSRRASCSSLACTDDVAHDELPAPALLVIHVGFVVRVLDDGPRTPGELLAPASLAPDDVPRRYSAHGENSARALFATHDALHANSARKASTCVKEIDCRHVTSCLLSIPNQGRALMSPFLQRVAEFGHQGVLPSGFLERGSSVEKEDVFVVCHTQGLLDTS